VLAHLERSNRRIAQLSDRRLQVARHGDGPMHLHIDQTDVAGGYHVGMYIEGVYCPDHAASSGHDGHDHGHRHGTATTAEGKPSGCHAGCRPQPFSRILTSSVAVTSDATPRRATRKTAMPPARRSKRTRR